MARFEDRDPRLFVDGLAWPAVVHVPFSQGTAVVRHVPPWTQPPDPSRSAQSFGADRRENGDAREADARVLLLDGPPAVGKSTAQRLLGRNPHVAILPKFKTGLRQDEQGAIDGRAIDPVTFQRLARSHDFYSYQFGGERYGFFRRALVDARNRCSLVALVVRNSNLLRALLQEFPSASAVLILADRDVAIARAGNSAEAGRRLARTDEFWRDYDFSLYAHTIVNHGSAEHFAEDVQRLVTMYLKEDFYVPQPAA